MLQLQSLSKTFVAGDAACGTSVRVLGGVCLTVSSGQIVVLSGEHGSGKTTLLRCMAGLLRPDAGVRRTLDADAVRYWPGAYDWRRAAVRDAARPCRVHLLDEPTFDFPGARAEFCATLRRLCVMRHAVVIATSLPLREFTRIAPRETRYYRMDGGRLVALMPARRPAVSHATELSVHAFG